jgi:hypothetical protein
MTSKLRPARLLVAACVLALGLSSIAVAATRKSHASSVLVKVFNFDTTGGTITSAGLGKDVLLGGDVTVIIRTKVSGSTLNGTAIEFGKLGTLKSKVKLTLKSNADGSTSFTGPGTYTGGTGGYKGATGAYQVTALQPKDTTKPITIKTKGTVKF